MENIYHQIDDVQYLAQRIEEGSSFESDLQTFAEVVDRLRRDLYRASDHPRVLSYLEELPPVEFSAHQRSFLEQMLPRGARHMWGQYQNKQKIIARVREIAAIFTRIRRLLENDLIR